MQLTAMLRLHECEHCGGIVEREVFALHSKCTNCCLHRHIFFYYLHIWIFILSSFVHNLQKTIKKGILEWHTSSTNILLGGEMTELHVHQSNDVRFQIRVIVNMVIKWKVL
jgi:hypothetical protein